MSGGALLAVERMTVRYGKGSGSLRAVHDVSFAIAPGEAYGLIGESGSGKSTIAFSVMRDLRGGRVEAGRILLRDRDLLDMPRAELANLRGREIAMVYQDPQSALNPALPVGEQIAEAMRRHEGVRRREASARTLALLEQVRLPEPAEIAQRYPHQLSGGQQQRIVIAMALACQPALLIMDEPTTGLDVTTEAAILDLIAELRRASGVAILFISHNLAVVAQVCDRVGVLYAGEMMEEGTTREILRQPCNPYTRGLLDSVPGQRRRQRRLAALPGSLPDLTVSVDGCVFAPRCGIAEAVCRSAAPALVAVGPVHASRCHFPPSTPASNADHEETAQQDTPGHPPGAMLRLTNLRKHFPQRGGRWSLMRHRPVMAVDGVSLEVGVGETLAIVGESGSGKSTLAKCLVGLIAPSEGALMLDGERLGALAEARPAAVRRQLQVVFQNPESALNPAQTVAQILARPLRLYGLCGPGELAARVGALLAMVKLGYHFAGRYPRQLSGGEKQRVCIARAFAAEPRLVVCDEPTSALDISVQAALLNELMDLQSRHGTSYVFISHDLGVVRYIAHRVAVMYLGHVVQTGPTEAVFSPPHHPYTEALLAALPSIEGRSDRRHIRLGDSIPDPANPPRGCVFHTRCPRKIGGLCEREVPPMRHVSAHHTMQCHIPVAELAALQTLRAGGDDDGSA